MRPAPFEERLPKSWAAVSVAERIDLEFHFEPQFAAELVDHDHEFGAAGGIGTAKNLDSELVELAKAAFLRALAAKHRPVVEKALLRIAAIEAGVDICPHYAGCPFRAQGEGRLRFVTIGEGVHLLLDYVGSLAARPLVEFETL